MISEEIDAWIWESSSDGYFISASAQVQDIIGYSPAELVGKTFADLLAREILSITGITIHETGMAGKGARFEMFVPKGSYRRFVPESGSVSEQMQVPDFISQTHHNHTI
ncbi:PAS domain-containing protein [Methanoregula sp.]